MNRIHELKKPNVSDRKNSEKTGITGNPSRGRKRFCRRQPAFAPSTGAKGGEIDNSGAQEKIIHILYEGGIALSDTGNPV